MTNFDKAKSLLFQFKGNNYLYGPGVLQRVGEFMGKFGKQAALVSTYFPGIEAHTDTIRTSIYSSGIDVLGEVEGARPNSPLEDLFRITDELNDLNPDVIIGFGGGSTLDAIKAAEVLRTLGGNIDDYFGTGNVTKVLDSSGKNLTPIVAIQTAASSAAHLTKYSNITDNKTGQKKLIVDSAIVPPCPIFDYSVTHSTPASLTADGGLDGLSHCLEVLYSAVGKSEYSLVESVALEGIRLVVDYLPQVMESPDYDVGRTALGLATDLGGYAIMLGGTNGAHLTSFSLVDILSHGRACAIMNPYYTVFFAPAVQDALRKVGLIFKGAGYTNEKVQELEGQDLGIAVAEAIIEFEESIGFPTTLGEVPGFSDEHIHRALNAAKDPQLKMKLENMPIPLTSEMVDDIMGPILYAARDGDLNKIRNV
jgi:alcohol dehydrogenase